MGQKVNPIGYRLGFIRTWNSVWYSKEDYSKFIGEDIKIRDYINKKLSTVGISSIKIERASKNLKINIYSSRPGIIIGKKGSGTEQLKNDLVKFCKLSKTVPVINVFEVKKPDLNAELLANNIKMQLEKRASFRRVMKKAVSDAMRSGAKGVKIICSGRLGGAEMSRSEKYMEGRVPLHTLRSYIDYSSKHAYTQYGVIGVKVWVYVKEVFRIEKDA